ncbi:MAG: hypothetical protein QF412_07995 [Planctomycetota bacterium]|jgi:hypothetical protein|nr:hypothetical protein [Planctomycetota bacterium]
MGDRSEQRFPGALDGPDLVVDIDAFGRLIGGSVAYVGSLAAGPRFPRRGQEVLICLA